VANSTAKGRKSKPTKPQKPHPDFPLFPHATGRWAKKIRQKLHYFGKWDDPQAALDRWLDQKDDLLAGRTPRPKADGVSVADACNEFLGVKQDRLDSGELSAASFRDYFEVAKLVIEFFGRNRLVDDLSPTDFSRFRARMAKKHGVHRMSKNITVTRMICRFAYESELIEKPVRFGPTFKIPSKKAKRKSDREGGKKYFDSSELRSILDASSQPMRAMILLGINAGYGQTDVANLPRSAIDLDSGWIDFPRPKTEINRRCPLWPETVDALREAAEHRGTPKSEADVDCVFISKYGNRLVRMTPNDTPAKRSHVDSIGPAFKRLAASVGVNDRRGFYALRHTFETVAGESKDQVAVDAIMGHVDPSMASNYRHSISDERLRAVVDVVRNWLWPEVADAG
jgi:integrase